MTSGALQICSMLEHAGYRKATLKKTTNVTSHGSACEYGRVKVSFSLQLKEMQKVGFYENKFCFDENSVYS